MREVCNVSEREGGQGKLPFRGLDWTGTIGQKGELDSSCSYNESKRGRGRIWEPRSAFECGQEDQTNIDMERHLIMLKPHLPFLKHNSSS